MPRSARASRAGGSTGITPDVIHIHDWHTGPAALLRDTVYRDDPALSRAAIMLTVHNLAYHGWTPEALVPELAWAPRPRRSATGTASISARRDRARRARQHRQPGLRRGGAHTCVRDGPRWRSSGQGDRFLGILNGLDTDLWDPATDAALPATYSRDDRTGKAACRAALLEELGLGPADDRPVLSMIGRLDRQKGFDLLADATPALLEQGFRLAVLGTGSPEVVAPLRTISDSPKGRGRIALVDRFDRDLARQMYAGSDGFLMPSRFEPCGTGQMIGLRYGTRRSCARPAAFETRWSTRMQSRAQGPGSCSREDPRALVDACERFDRHRAAGGSWGVTARPGMAVDFDWRSSSAPAYLQAYRRAIAARQQIA